VSSLTDSRAAETWAQAPNGPPAAGQTGGDGVYSGTMMRKAGLLGSLALLLVSACGAEEERSGIATARSQMKPLVDAACDWMFGCCSPDELVYQVGNFTVDAGDCSERLLDAISAGVPLDLVQGGLSSDPAEGLLTLALAINEGRVDVNGSAVNKCADATSDRACNFPQVSEGPVGRCTPSATAVEANPCDPIEMFRGRQDVGEQCDGPWECKEGLRCADLGIAGVCALRASEDESCFSDGECSDGLVCNFAEGVCQPGAKSGETCAYTDPANPIPGTEVVRCADGLTCDPVAFVCAGGFCSPGSPCFDTVDDSDCPQSFYCVGNFFTQPTCQIPGLVGSPCSKADDCETNFCDPFNEVCSELLGTGSDCFGNGECSSGFCFNGLCQLSVENGMPCASGFNEECRDGYCDNLMVPGTCTGYADENGPCPNGSECNPDDDLFCVDAVCLRQPFPNGTTCFDSSQCESRACYMGECTAGAVIGAACATDGSAEPCIVGSYCQAPIGAVDGICTELKRPGQACENSDQCWGECVVRFGALMCDATTAVDLDEVWCDGEE
jgi:hypothetical protein